MRKDTWVLLGAMICFTGAIICNQIWQTQTQARSAYNLEKLCEALTEGTHKPCPLKLPKSSIGPD